MATKKSSADEKGVKQCPAGTVLFREDEEGDRIYIVRSGTVRLSKRIEETEIVVEELGAGAFCGELVLVGGARRPVTATMVEDGTVIPLDKDQFETMVRGNPEIAVRMLKRMSARLTEAQFRVSNLVLRRSAARLIHQLRHEVRRHAEARGKTVHHPTPLPDNLAEILSIEIGELKQLLEQFVRDELIAVDRNGYFQILDEDALHRYLRYLELRDRFEPIQ